MRPARYMSHVYFYFVLCLRCLSLWPSSLCYQFDVDGHRMSSNNMLWAQQIVSSHRWTKIVGFCKPPERQWSIHRFDFFNINYGITSFNLVYCLMNFLLSNLQRQERNCWIQHFANANILVIVSSCLCCIAKIPLCLDIALGSVFGSGLS